MEEESGLTRTLSTPNFQLPTPKESRSDYLGESRYDLPGWLDFHPDGTSRLFFGSWELEVGS